MAKLIVKINHQFEANPLLHLNDSSDVVPLKQQELNKLLKDADDSQFSCSVTFLSPRSGKPSINFELHKKGMKKGGEFSWEINEAEGKVRVKVSGEFASGTLRSGVVPTLESEYAGAKLFLDAFNYKGGYFNGFRAPVAGQTEENCGSWYAVESWNIK